MGPFSQDLRFACRLLLKDKTFNLVALVTLALCIGANTAIFSVINSVILRPLPYPEPDRLVEIFNAYPNAGVPRAANGVPDYFDRKKETDIFEEVTLYQGRSFNVGVEGSPARITGMAATPSYFRVLRIAPLLGRTFTEEEGQRGNDRVAILSRGFWQELYGGSADAIGKDIRLSGNLYSIVGVVPENPLRPGLRVWVPLTFTDQQMSDDGRHSNGWGMTGRLKPGISLEQSQQRIDTINKHNEELYPPKILNLVRSAGFNTKVSWLKDDIVREISSTLWILQAAVALVLLIGCVNVANLLLVRSNVRLKELSIRAALGSGRWRLARLLLTESVLLGTCGGILGFLVGISGVRLLPYLGADQLPRASEISIDWTVLLFALGISVLTGLLFGTAPVVNVLRSNLADIFRQNGRTGTTHRPAIITRAILVVTQVALAFILLAGSGLMISSFMRVLRVDPGFNTENVLTGQISLPYSRYGEDSQVRAFIRRALENTRSLPGIQYAGITDYLPFTNQNNSSVTMVVGHELAPGELPPVPGRSNVSPGYFHAMGIPLLAGRLIEDSDTDDSQNVAVIDSFLADKYFTGSNPIGRQLRNGVDENATVYTIVGIVGSIKNNDLTEADPVGMVYYSYQQREPRNFSLVVKQDRAGAPLTAPIRAEILRLDSELPLYDVSMMGERMDDSLMQRRAMLWLSSIFAGLALLLSAIGIYGVLAYAVGQRTQEIGIRMALGAETGTVLKSVVVQGLKLAGVGLIIGLIGAAYFNRYLESVLFNVAPSDPMVFVSVSVVLAAAALLASLIPSFRAAQIHPAIALRHE